MDDSQLRTLNIALEAVTGCHEHDSSVYINALDDDDFVLDGHFTLAHLEAIVAQIKLHRCLDA